MPLSYVLRNKNTSSRLTDTLFSTVDRVCGVQSLFCHWYKHAILSVTCGRGVALCPCTCENWYWI